MKDKWQPSYGLQLALDYLRNLPIFIVTTKNEVFSTKCKAAAVVNYNALFNDKIYITLATSNVVCDVTEYMMENFMYRNVRSAKPSVKMYALYVSI